MSIPWNKYYLTWGLSKMWIIITAPASPNARWVEELDYSRKGGYWRGIVKRGGIAKRFRTGHSRRRYGTN